MDNSTLMIRRQKWLQIINECNKRTSGTKLEWCRENGIDIRRFYYWQRNLRLLISDQIDVPDEVTVTHAERNNNQQLPAAPVFAELTPLLDQRPSVQTASDADGSCTIPEVVIQLNDCRILLNSSVQEETLIKVIRSIRNA